MVTAVPPACNAQRHLSLWGCNINRIFSCPRADIGRMAFIIKMQRDNPRKQLDLHRLKCPPEVTMFANGSRCT